MSQCDIFFVRRNIDDAADLAVGEHLHEHGDGEEGLQHGVQVTHVRVVLEPLAPVPPNQVREDGDTSGGLGTRFSDDYMLFFQGL